MKRGFINRKMWVAGVMALTLTALTLTGCGAKAEMAALDSVSKAEVAVQENITAGKAQEAGSTTSQGDKEEPQVISLGQMEKLEEAVGTPDFIASGETIDDPKLQQIAVDGFKEYFGVTVDPSEFNVDIVYYEAFDDFEAEYLILFDAPGNREILTKEGNIGNDGFPVPEALETLKPEFSANLTDKKEIKGLSLSYMGWEKSAVPLTVEESKKAAEEFMQSHKMIVDDRIEFLGATVISSTKISMLYGNGEDGAIQIAVDPYTGKVEHFGFWDRDDIVAAPVKEGSGLG